MGRVFVYINGDFSKVPNMHEMLEKEHAAAAKWKTEGSLEHLFVKENAGGVLLVFKNKDKETVKQMIATLPLFPWFSEVNYQIFEKSF
jgi:muconolactone delta-isomerase